ncbi:MAG TPA: hypothetical protein VEU55_03510 [Gemmatimonadales bacterium]|nr:hypothetical protein [Gemmatimonadales bacterium]
MALTSGRGPGRLVLGVLAYGLVAPVSLVALPFAALVLAARPRATRERLAVALAGGVSGALLVAPASGLLDALTRAWIVLVAAAFALSAALRPARFWPLALRACLYAAAALAVLARTVGGPTIWRAVQWDATRGASLAVRPVLALLPGLYPAFEPVVRVLASGWPLWLLLETVAGLALAWHAHVRVAHRPLAAAAASRETPVREDVRPVPAPGAVVNP